MSSIRYAQEWSLIQKPYVFTMVLRPLAGTLYVEIDTGDTLGSDSIWQIELELVGNDLVLSNGGAGSPYVLTGAGDGGYHEIQLRGSVYYLDLYYASGEELVSDTGVRSFYTFVAGFTPLTGLPELTPENFVDLLWLKVKIALGL